MHLSRSFVLLAVVLLAMNAPAVGSDWTRFRGPGGSGVSTDSGIPVKFSEKENLRWKVELPGDGTSSPVVVGDAVIVTCFSGYGTERGRSGSQNDLMRHVVLVDRKSGKIRWQKEVKPYLPEDRENRMLAGHGYSSSTPATDGERIYVFFGKTGLLCYDMEGKEVWKKSLGTGSGIMGWGTAASPILYKDLVIMNASAEDGAVVALDKKTGEQKWKQKLPALSGSWSTPVVARSKEPERDELVLSVQNELWALAPDTGKLLWYADGVAPSAIAPSLIAHDGVVYAIGGRSPQATAVKVGGKGDVNSTHVLWKNRRGAYVTSPVLYEGRLYVIADRGGRMFCMNAKTGETVFESRISGAGSIYASPTIVEGKIYIPTRNSGVYVLDAGAKYEQIAKNTFADDQSTFNASPAVANNEMFIRSNKFLYCISAADSDSDASGNSAKSDK